MATYTTASQIQKGDTIINNGAQWTVDSNNVDRQTGTHTVALSNDSEFTELYLLPASPVLRVSVGGIDTTTQQHLSLADTAMASVMELTALAGRYAEIQSKFQSAVATLESLGYTYNGEWKK